MPLLFIKSSIFRKIAIINLVVLTIYKCLLPTYLFFVVILKCTSQDFITHLHIWRGKHHHHFRRKMQIDQSSEDSSSHQPSFETASHPKGTVLAPMAGLVVKVLVDSGSLIEKGQSVLVLESMKMEVCIFVLFFLIIYFILKILVCTFFALSACRPGTIFWIYP